MAATSICGRNDRMGQHRLMYKGKTPPWKDKYRQRCRDRLKEARESLLSRFRQFPESCCAAHLSTVQQVMNDEWTRMEVSEEQCHSNKENVDVTTSDCEVNYDLSVMEDIQKELLDEEQKLLAVYQEHLVDRYYGSDGNAEETVLCPVCHRYFMTQSRNFISCRCGIQLHFQQDGLTLQHLKRQLDAGLEEHNTACSSFPRFTAAMERGSHSLIMTCVDCDHMYIVI